MFSLEGNQINHKHIYNRERQTDTDIEKKNTAII